MCYSHRSILVERAKKEGRPIHAATGKAPEAADLGADFPPIHRQAWNLARSLADFIADGCRTVSEEEYRARLEICDGCESRRANRCMKCGCRLSLKAQGRAFKCPADKWPIATETTEHDPKSTPDRRG